MQESNKGLIYGLTAFTLWGFIVIFYKQFDGVSPYEIVAHRVIWSVATLFLILAALGRVRSSLAVLQDFRTAGWLFASGWLVTGSWFLFVYAVEKGLVVEASLGNFICPLISVALGYLVLKEQLSTLAKFAVTIVAVAVAVQVVAVGSLPTLALTLAFIVALYGLIRKQVRVPALEGLFVETLMTFPVALGYSLWLLASGESGFELNLNGVLLVLCGPITALPLLLFTASARRVSLATLGYVQYINPTISMLLAVFLYGEPLPAYKIASFALIWLALAILSIQGVRTLRGMK